MRSGDAEAAPAAARPASGAGMPPGCSASAPPATAATRRLSLFVIDGLPQRQLDAYRDQLAPDGLARFLTEGTAFSEAHYGHAYTVTAAGHATLLTGAAPHRSGIIGNEWRDPASGERVYCTADPDAHYLDHPTPSGAGTSPRNLMVESLGDVLRKSDARAKVIAVSGKDRGAILPAGRSGRTADCRHQARRFWAGCAGRGVFLPPMPGISYWRGASTVAESGARLEGAAAPGTQSWIAEY